MYFNGTIYFFFFLDPIKQRFNFIKQGHEPLLNYTGYRKQISSSREKIIIINIINYIILYNYLYKYN